MDFQTDKIFSDDLDKNDILSTLKEKFIFPLSDPIYLCGHSLGLQPKSTNRFVTDELESWASSGVK